MVTIQENADLVTLVVVFTVEPERQAAHVEVLRNAAAAQSTAEGLISCSILASEDGTRVVEHIQWSSHAHLQAMLDSQAGAAHLQDPTFVADVHSYTVASVVLGPDGSSIAGPA